ncbi:MAG: TerD family protein [Actinomycetota bacterium]
MLELDKGANAPIPAHAVRVTLSWDGRAGVPNVDASAVLCGSNGLVASDADFVFFNQATHPSGAVRHLGKSTASDSLAVDLSLLSESIDRIALVGSSNGGTFGQVPALVLTVTDVASGQDLVQFHPDATTETALVAGELYRRAGSWKFRAVGQGYRDGLAGLARGFGIHIDDPKPVSPVSPVARSTPDSSLKPLRPTAIDWMNPPVPAGYEL